MKKSAIGFGALVLMGAYLYVSIVMANIPGNVLTGFTMALILLAGMFAVFGEAHQARQAKGLTESPFSLKMFASVAGGALLTYSLSSCCNLSSAVASGLVTLSAGILFPSASAGIACGSFAGMASPALLDYPGVLAAGCIAGFIFLAAADTFNGFGGKLGTAAATGTCVAAFITGGRFLEAKPLGSQLIVPVVMTAIVSSVLAYCINNRMKQGGVVASGMVSLIGGLVLPAVFPAIGSILAAVCACGSYVGMSTMARIPNELYATMAGLLSGLAYFAGNSVLGGAGGKLGTIAFGSVLAASFVAGKIMKR